MDILYFIVVLLPALAFTLYNRHYNRSLVTCKELSLSLVANTGIACASLFIFFLFVVASLADTEVINGIVTAKSQETVSCSHSYKCNPTEVYDHETGTTETVYETCYYHDFDYDWVVYTSVGNVTVDRIDEQGISTPARFEAARVGEPASLTSLYINYFLADPESLFLYSERISENYDGKLPAYPMPYDLYRYSRVINQTNLNVEAIEYMLNAEVARMASNKQLNLIAVITDSPTDDFYYALMSAWKGGKKNDVIMVFGVDSDYTVKWFRSTSLAKGKGNHLLHSYLARVTEGKKLSEELVATQLQLIEKHFTRLSMDEFSFKKYMVDIPLWFIVLVLLFNVVASYYIGQYTKNN